VGFYKGRNKGMPPMIQLTGQDLLQHRENCRAVGMAAADIVRAAGYIGQRKDGSEKLNFTRYYEEVFSSPRARCTELMSTSGKLPRWVFSQSSHIPSPLLVKVPEVCRVRCGKSPILPVLGVSESSKMAWFVCILKVGRL
jgi:hypothetical protein